MERIRISQAIGLIESHPNRPTRWTIDTTQNTFMDFFGLTIKMRLLLNLFQEMKKTKVEEVEIETEKNKLIIKSYSPKFEYILYAKDIETSLGDCL